MTGTVNERVPVAPADTLRRLFTFIQERCPPKMYVTYSVLWVLALTGSLHLAAPQAPAWRLSPGLLGEIATVWLTLLFGRIVDEQKDLEYDRIHNPGRPLPRGAISVRELRWAMAAVVTVILALQGWSHPLATLWLLFDLGYICFLVQLDRWSARVRDGIFLNLLVSYPVQLMLSVHIWLLFMADTGVGPSWSAPLLIAMCAGTFLHFEFARKTSHRKVEGAHLYSNAVGVRGSVGLTLGMALSAALVAVCVLRPWEVSGLEALAAWSPLSAMGFVWMGADRFRAGAVIWPASTAMGFLAWFYLGLAVHALVVANVVVTW